MHYSEIPHGKELLDALQHSPSNEASFKQLRLTAGISGVAWQSLRASVRMLCLHGWLKNITTISINKRTVPLFYGPCKPMH